MWIMPAIIQRLALQTKEPCKRKEAKVSDEDAGVITKYVFEGSVPGGWQGRVDVTLELNSDYNGEVFVANYLDPAFPHGFVITDIRFVAKQNPETSDMGMIPLVVLTLTGFVPLKRRRVK